MKFSAAFLIIVAMLAYYVAWPWARNEYRSFKASLRNIEYTLDIRAIADAAKDTEQDEALARIERRQESQSVRLDRLSDRVSRIEGRQR